MQDEAVHTSLSCVPITARSHVTSFKERTKFISSMMLCWLNGLDTRFLYRMLYFFDVLDDFFPVLIFLCFKSQKGKQNCLVRFRNEIIALALTFGFTRDKDHKREKKKNLCFKLHLGVRSPKLHQVILVTFC